MKKARTAARAASSSLSAAMLLGLRLWGLLRVCCSRKALAARMWDCMAA